MSASPVPSRSAASQVADMIQSTLFGVLKPPSDRVAGLPADLESLVLLAARAGPRPPAHQRRRGGRRLDQVSARHGYRWQLNDIVPSAPVTEGRSPGFIFEAQWVATAQVEVG